VVFTPFLVLLFADELVRFVAGPPIEPPIPLPPGAEIREAPRLTRIIGAPSGGAAAVTIGRTILIPHLRLYERPSARRPRLLPGDTLLVSAAVWREVIEHERVHVLQRERHGRMYLPIYVFWYLRRGYMQHPFEREAREKGKATAGEGEGDGEGSDGAWFEGVRCGKSLLFVGFQGVYRTVRVFFWKWGAHHGGRRVSLEFRLLKRGDGISGGTV
jgi:hypothetical protein